MNKKKYIIGAVLLLILTIVAFFMFKSKQPNNEITGGSLTSNTDQNSDNASQEYELSYFVDGDSEGVTTKIDEYIPSMEEEEIQETLSQEVSKDQKGAIEEALCSWGPFRACTMCVCLFIIPPYSRFVKTEKNDGGLY